MSDSAPTLFPLSPDHFPMIVHDAPVRDHSLSHQMMARWQAMRATNPRLFDGPLLALRHLDRSSGTLAVQRDSYMPYAVQPEVDTATISLGVTAILAHGTGSSAAYLFGQRASTTHMYPDQWELGPSGAIVPPQGKTLTLDHLLGQLSGELSEEIGLALSLTQSNTTPVCMALDPTARSIDLVMLIALNQRPELRTNWEYRSAEWVSVSQFPAWSAPRRVIPPTVTIMQWLADPHRS